MSPLAKRTSVVAGLFGLLTTVYWQLLFFPSRFVWFDHYDLSQLQIPRLQFFARSLHAGHFPLWNPHTWLGQPVLGSGQPGPLNPLILFFARFLPLRDGALSFTELNWLYLALHFLAALFAYRFCRYLALPVLPSLLGAVAFSCTGFLGSVAWLDVSSAVALTPLIFYFAFRLWTEERVLTNAVPLGLVLGLSWWTGHHEIPLINCYAVLFGSICVVASRKGTRPVITGTMVAFALAIPISAIQTLPFYEFGHASKRWVGASNPIGWAERVPYEVHERLSLPWLGLGEFFAPGGAPEDHWTAFAGVTILALAIAALIYRWSDRRVRMLGFLALGSLLYALGAHTPIHRLVYEFLPLADKARSPGRGIFLAGFALSALAAVGADLMIRRVMPRRGIWIPAAVSMGVLGVYWSGRLPEMEFPIATHFVVKGLIAAAALGILIWSQARVAGIVLLAIVVLEASTLTAHRITDLDSGAAVVAPSLLKFKSLAGNLPSTGQGRIVADYNSLLTDLGDLYGVDVLQTFVAAVPENVLRFEFHTARTQQLLGVTHRVEGGQIRAVPDAMARAWIVHRVTVSKDLDTGEDFATTAVSVNPLALEECQETGTPSFTRPDSDSISVNAELRCRGLLVVSETFYPGWKAYVDGQPQPIYEVFGALRGVVLESGKHRVEMRYRPTVVWMGAALSFSAIALGLVLIIRDRKESKDGTKT